MKLVVQPVQRRADIVALTDAVSVLAFAQPAAAKVKAQNRKAKAVERLHGMKHNLIVHRPAKHGMRMAHQSGESSIVSARVE